MTVKGRWTCGHRKVTLLRYADGSWNVIIDAKVGWRTQATVKFPFRCFISNTTWADLNRRTAV